MEEIEVDWSEVFEELDTYYPNDEISTRLEELYEVTHDRAVELLREAIGDEIISINGNYEVALFLE